MIFGDLRYHYAHLTLLQRSGHAPWKGRDDDGDDDDDDDDDDDGDDDDDNDDDDVFVMGIFELHERKEDLFSTSHNTTTTAMMMIMMPMTKVTIVMAIRVKIMAFFPFIGLSNNCQWNLCGAYI